MALISTLTLVVVCSLIVPAAPATASACFSACNLYGSSTPSTVDSGPDSSVKLAMKFHVDTYGFATGVRFYKAAANTGTHVGQLWAYFDAGHRSLLSTVTFTGETASGWQTAYFSQPVSLKPGMSYMASYIAPNGHYSFDNHYYDSMPTTSPIQIESPGGMYTYTSGSPLTDAPTNLSSNANYWVDVTFESRQNETSLFDMATPTPDDPDVSDPGYVQVGTRFTSDINTMVKGVRFWGNSRYMKSYFIYLWDSDGTLLASAYDADAGGGFQGWMELYFTSPVAISAGAEYTVSIYQPDDYPGGYGQTLNYFTAPQTHGMFHTPANAGAYVYLNSGDPVVKPSSQVTTNFWVDPVFSYVQNQVVSTTVDPSFTFSVAGKSSACNGESNFSSGAGATSSVSLGHLAAGTNVSGGQTLTVSSNAGAGFSVYLRGTLASSNLRASSHNWTDVAGSYASPAALGAGERFGYTYKDSTISSSLTNPTSAYFVALDATNRAVMGSAASASGTGCVSFDAQASSSTPAASYSATLFYTAIPSF